MMNARPLISWMALGLATLALGGCGGGDQVEKFRPSNIVSFGDESSAFAQEAVGSGVIQGLKYTVNELIVEPGADLVESGTSVGTFPSDVFTVTTSFPVPFPTSATPPVTAEGAASVVPTNIVKQTFKMDVAYSQSSTTGTVTDALVSYNYLYNCGLLDSNVAANRIWIQLLASSYGKSYSTACPLDIRIGAVTYAQPGAKVADVIAQITTNLGTIGSKTLATVLAGQNDVIEQYDTIYPSGASTAPAEGTIQTAENELKSRAVQLAGAINSIANTKARTLVLTLPDLSYSPYVQSETNATVRASRAAVMRRLVLAFNDALFSEGGVKNDGRVIGRVKVFELIQDMAVSPGSFGLVDGTKAVCDPLKLRSIDTATTVTATDTSADLKYCNTHTLIDKPTPSSSTPTAYNYLWAQDTWLTPAGHAAIANRAFQRADNDVF